MKLHAKRMAVWLGNRADWSCCGGPAVAGCIDGRSKGGVAVVDVPAWRDRVGDVATVDISAAAGNGGPIGCAAGFGFALSSWRGVAPELALPVASIVRSSVAAASGRPLSS